MDWNDEEARDLSDVHAAAGPHALLRIRAVANRAVELVAARGGTMTVDDLADLRESMASLKQKHPAIAEEIGEALRHITSQGATVATLQAKVAELEGEVTGLRTAFDDEQGIARRALNERDALRAEVERLTARVRALDQDSADAMENWRLAQKREQKERVSRKAAESRLAAIRERFAALECDAAERVNLQWVLEGDVPQGVDTSTRGDYGGELREEHEDAPQEATEADDETCDHCAMPGGKHSYMPTTYDEVPEMCPLASKHPRYPCSPTCTHDDAATPGHPERVKERSEAVREVASMADVDPVAALAKEAGAKNGHEVASFRVGHEQGAEAMRAACWETAQLVLTTFGIPLDSPCGKAMKVAIEGATP